jgi:hypothetical protein
MSFFLSSIPKERLNTNRQHSTMKISMGMLIVMNTCLPRRKLTRRPEKKLRARLLDYTNMRKGETNALLWDSTIRSIYLTDYSRYANYLADDIIL